MSDLHRKNFIAQEGERFTLLVNEDGIPDFWTTLDDGNIIYLKCLM